MKIIYINNAGLLLDWGGGRMLVDVIQFYKSRFSDPLPQGLWETMLSGDGPLRHVDYIAATHVHPDHVSSGGVAEYVLANRVRGLILPPATALDVEEKLSDAAPRAGLPERLILTEDGGETELCGGARLSWFKTAHIGNNFRFVSNFCLRLERDGASVLITGDAEPEREPFEESGVLPSDVAVTNPMFFNDITGRRILRELSPFLALYHLPKPGGENMTLIRHTQREIERSKHKFDRLTVFSEPFESIEI